MHIMIYKYLLARKKVHFTIEGAQTWGGEAFAPAVGTGQAAPAARFGPMTCSGRKHSSPKMKQRTETNMARKLVLKVSVRTSKTPF